MKASGAKLGTNHGDSLRTRSLSPVQERRQSMTDILQRAQNQGGLTLLVDGLAGMGKTCTLRELRSLALEDGRWQVTVVRADEFEEREPYSFIERIVAASQIREWNFEPSTLVDPIPVARECIQRLLSDDTVAGRVFILDDAQWIDAESHRVLRYLIPRITRRNMLLAFGIRSPHEPGSFGAFICGLIEDNHLDQRVQATPLTASQLIAFVAEQHGVVIPTATAKHMVEVTGGSFLAIDSVVSSMTREELEQIHLGWDPADWSGDGETSPLLKQFRALDSPSRATAELVSIAGHALSQAEISAAASLLGEPVRLNASVEAGVLAISPLDSQYAARHSLLAKAIVDELTEARARTLYRALAAVTEGYRSLRHQLMGATVWDSNLDALVGEYVSRAVAERKFAIASDVLRASLTLTMAPSVRMRLIESLVLVHLQAKTGYLVLDLVDEIGEFAPTLLHRLMYNVVSAHQVGRAISQDAVYEILSSTPKDADERAILAFYSFMVVLLSMRTAEIDRVPQLIEHSRQLVLAAPSTPNELRDPRLGWMVEKDARLLVLDCYRMVQHQFGHQYDTVASSLPNLTKRIHELEDSPLKVDAVVAVAGAEVALGNIDTAHSMIEFGVEMLERVGEPWAAGTARVILGHIMVLRGEFKGAIELMELTEEVTFSALDVESRSSWAAIRLMIAAIMGDAQAEMYVEQTRRHRKIAWEGYSPDLGVIAECEFYRARNDIDGVLDATSHERTASLRNTQHGFLTYRAHALLDRSRLEESRTLVDQLARWRGSRWQEYWGTLDWLSARLAQLEGDHGKALWHYEAAIQDDRFPLPHGLSLADFGRFLVERGSRKEGFAMLRSAVGILQRIGAVGYVAEIEKLLAGADVGTSKSGARTQVLSLLTERELQIVDHLVKGRSNNQISESFIVSVATVRSHISNILRKLGLNSRGEVARLMREHGEKYGYASDDAAGH